MIARKKMCFITTNVWNFNTNVKIIKPKLLVGDFMIYKVKKSSISIRNIYEPVALRHTSEWMLRIPMFRIKNWSSKRIN